MAKVFETGWTGGPNAVIISVHEDKAVAQWFDSPKRVTVPLTAEQVADLRRVWADAPGDGRSTESAIAVANALKRIAGDKMGDFSTLYASDEEEEWPE
ncbi:hypothetical protein [Azospirillum sp. TSO5]|uniref:hypothetical protein n=1 Tax=Azospirillum sp. TSO5 TaxID=716760 RepID=UPI000D611DC6|nr:hypothetical protein [Azospirillum sp. TSO5]PWC98059.1 hypothetical protein TSO5_03395 [Azospirillum sp. TSO5]